jgi:ubiquinone biosynthesis protein
MVIEELGTTFIKFGQILSQRTDLLPEDLIRELSKLQDKIDPVSIDVSGLIAETFGQPIDDYFSSFNNIPIGVASIGQVYEGILKNGDHVVLKIRKPDVDEIVSNDLKLMGDLLNVVRNHPAIREFNPIELFDSFRETLLNELDYQKEANNIKRFGHSYTEDPHIHVPIVYSTLCTKDIICMEYISGLKIDDSVSISNVFPDSSRLIELVCNYYFDQILEKVFIMQIPILEMSTFWEMGKYVLLIMG